MSTEAQKLGLDLEEIIEILRANIAPMHATVRSWTLSALSLRPCFLNTELLLVISIEKKLDYPPLLWLPNVTLLLLIL